MVQVPELSRAVAVAPGGPPRLAVGAEEPQLLRPDVGDDQAPVGQRSRVAHAVERGEAGGRGAPDAEDGLILHRPGAGREARATALDDSNLRAVPDDNGCLGWVGRIAPEDEETAGDGQQRLGSHQMGSLRWRLSCGQPR